jgi:hypothetical protein
LKCGDLLEKYAEKPEKCHFIDCEKGTGQTIMTATYSVNGNDSYEVEELLIEKYDIGPLKFTCCGWESTDGKNGYVENDALKKFNPNYVLEISMYGNAERKDPNDEWVIEKDRTKIEYNITAKIIEV